jgi:hypothetical protein
MGRSLPRRGLVALAAAVAIWLGACGPTQFRYVRSPDSTTAFKIPSDWTTFGEQAFLHESGPQPSTPDPIRWLVALDGDPRPSLDHILNMNALDTSHPEGIALVLTLSAADRDRMSLEGIRNFLIPVDQLLNQGSDDAEILSYDDTLSPGGDLRGSRLSFEFRPSMLSQLGASAGEPPSASSVGGTGSTALSDDFVVMHQIAYLDAGTNRVYLMALFCDARCDQRYNQDIQGTIDSWTVRP